MLPSLRELIDVEMLRDGGSLAATYSDGRQEAFLFLKINIRVHDDGRRELVKFEKPVIRGGYPVQWCRPIDWREARQALQRMIEMSGELSLDKRLLLTIMARVVDLDGFASPKDDILAAISASYDLTFT